MTAGELADIVLQARNTLRNWDGKSSALDLMNVIRDTLAPLGAADLSTDARRKLEEINQQLDRCAGSKFASRQRDALDTLMLGLWIRVELTARPSA